MDYKSISMLLEKYWEGETSLEEEAELREFFSTPHPDLPEALQEAAPLFGYFHEEATRELVMPPVPELTNTAKVIALPVFRHWMKYAAVLLIGIGLGYAFRQHHQQEQLIAANMQRVNMDDPQRAFAETKKALQLLARNLNKGAGQMQKLAYFNEATEMIEGKN
ncbi:hypothetical protein [Chitinophaga solisilvae]|uniref:hypothetical protein n=1 Tax=Chitinophaga solisilvae TaxID=1233460 RepID=UPI00136A5CA0|nr:hypothetical protein [Chitinophaga solisilvae]